MKSLLLSIFLACFSFNVMANDLVSPESVRPYRTANLSRYVLPAVVVGSTMMLPTVEAGPAVAGVVATGGAIMTAVATGYTFFITGGNWVAAGIVAEKGIEATSTVTGIALAAPTT